MTAVCPKCSTPAHDDFGFVTCSKCKAVFVIELDGSTRLFEASEDIQASAQGNDDIFDVVEENEEQKMESEQPPEVLSEIFEASDAVQTFQDAPLDFELEPLEEVEPQEEFVVQNDLSFEQHNEHSIEQVVVVNEEVQEDHQAQKIGGTPHKPFSSFEGGLVIDASITTEFCYDISINGIATAEDKKLVLDLLVDSRLGINRLDLLKSMSQATLVLRQVHPVKASLVVQRLRSTLFELSWRQNRVHNGTDISGTGEQSAESTAGDFE